VRYSDINILGIYVAPFAAMMLVAWLIALPLRGLGDRIGIQRKVWHPALFNIAVYIIVLALVVLLIGERL
jgi:protein AaeX